MTDKTQELADRFFTLEREYMYGVLQIPIETFTDTTILLSLDNRAGIIPTNVIKICVKEFTGCFVVKEGLVLGD